MSDYFYCDQKNISDYPPPDGYLTFNFDDDKDQRVWCSDRDSVFYYATKSLMHDSSKIASILVVDWELGTIHYAHSQGATYARLQSLSADLSKRLIPRLKKILHDKIMGDLLK